MVLQLSGMFHSWKLWCLIIENKNRFVVMLLATIAIIYESGWNIYDNRHELHDIMTRSHGIIEKHVLWIHDIFGNAIFPLTTEQVTILQSRKPMKKPMKWDTIDRADFCNLVHIAVDLLRSYVFSISVECCSKLSNAGLQNQDGDYYMEFFGL